MKYLVRLIVLAGLVAGASLTSFAAAFEGRMTFAITTGKDTSELTYAMKGEAMRMEIGAGNQKMASIIDLNKKEMVMLMPEQKMYMVLPIKEPVEKAIDETQLKQHKIEKTGRTDTILGYKVDEYVTKERNATTEIWIAEGLGTFMGMSSGGGGGPFGGGRKSAGQAWEEAFKGKPGFPLRVVSRDNKGKETYKMEATKIEKGSLPASLFQAPDDYQRFQMPGLGDLNPFKKKG